ncbi:hypothetical protein EJ05DRAFT_295684 [Pseudovirgaria hyperparasitica]|uniref:Uncharacterized protein n=1 Tax=Pseudovirgaria hyperparasitica TaxID=470096 RepID=A0A6A6VTL0_9PEZI|nr:uncharacterized protein EJ05DRAFT_295684 [Pseudovirgaria hyperparasitica]KAF2752577.1 hypothetical protein EJ05DRAFT_295684 [Pseudovirgaria hyperparasitica]
MRRSRCLSPRPTSVTNCFHSSHFVSYMSLITNSVELSLFQRSKGKLEKKVNIPTMMRVWNSIRRITSIRARYGYTQTEHKQMKSFIQKTLSRMESCSTKAFEKPIATIEVVKDLLTFLWQHDVHQFGHDRIPVQLSFILWRTSRRLRRVPMSSGYQ